MNKFKNIIIVFGFIGFLLMNLVGYIILPDVKTSFLERRNMTTKEELKEDITGNLDKYLIDQIPYRNQYLKLNTAYERNALKIKDKFGVYVINNSIYNKQDHFDKSSIKEFIKKINYINDYYYQNKTTYFTMIPDKNYYLPDSINYLKPDYPTLIKELNEINSTNIDITNTIDSDKYYLTDIHLKQTSWFPYIKELSNYLNFDYQPLTYTSNIYQPFYGANYGKALDLSINDELIYLTNNLQSHIEVSHLEYPTKSIYNIDKLSGIDAYNVYLDGPSSYIELFNKNISTDKELVIYRDSFASSLAPLLAPYYKKITLIDLRYINLTALDKYLTVNDNQDILFMYSVQSINNSSILKVN